MPTVKIETERVTMPDRLNTRRGMSLIELSIVLSIIGLGTIMAAPMLSKAWDAEQVRSAKVTFTGMHAKARAVAIQRSSIVVLDIGGGKILIRSVKPVTGVADTVGSVIDAQQQFGVTINASRDSLQFDSRGIGSESSSTSIVIARNLVSDTLVISRTGTFSP